MNQLIQIIISIIIGIIYGIIFTVSKNKKLFTLVCTIIITTLYIYLIYLLNNGTINYILKINLILGFLIYNYVSNLTKKV